MCRLNVFVLGCCRLAEFHQMSFQNKVWSARQDYADNRCRPVTYVDPCKKLHAWWIAKLARDNAIHSPRGDIYNWHSFNTEISFILFNSPKFQPVSTRSFFTPKNCSIFQILPLNLLVILPIINYHNAFLLNCNDSDCLHIRRHCHSRTAL
jgi:hypothetical protein